MSFSLRTVAALSIALAPSIARAQTPALATKLEPTGDTIYARVAGVVPPARMHRLVQELSIAPGAEDTTLFTRVYGFKVDRAGRFWVFDNATATIFLFGKDGKLVRRIGRKGGGPGEFSSDNGAVILAGDRFAMWDGQNARISWHAQDGSFEKSTLISKGFSTSNGLKTDRTGAVFITHPASKPIPGTNWTLGLIRVKPDGTFGDTLIPPDLKISAPSWTASSGGGTATYSSRNGPGRQWLWHPDGFFVSVDGSRSRIVLSRTAAKPIVIERQLAPVPIPSEEREDDRAFITWGLRQSVKDWTWSGADVPASKPALGAAYVARDGRIWVRMATPSERIPDNELPERRPNSSPPYRFRSPIEYEVFAANGTFLARVALPKDLQLMEADGNTLWALGKDDDDLPAVRRYRIEPALPNPR
jgi:hypothetical protein